MKKLFGVTVPIITPFDEKGEVDIPSMENLAEYIVQSGLHCLYPCGTTGEMLMLNQEERKAIVEAVVRQANHRVPVFAQVGAMNLRDTAELAKHAYDVGADGIGVITPAFFKLSDEELIEYYGQVAESIPEDYPMYLYAIPQNAVNDINPYVASQVASMHRNVVGIKYSYPNVSRIQQFMLINNGTFSVLVGPDELFEAVVAVGGDGTVSGNSMIIPEHYLAVWDALQKKDFEAATKLQRRTTMLNGILCAQNNIASYKVMLKEKGIIKTSMMRSPFGQLSPEEEKALIKKLTDNHYGEVIL